MSKLAQFQQIVDAEQYFEFFGLPYDAQFVNVNRLHILQKFSNYIKAIDRDSPELNDEQRLSQYRNALQQAYDVFLASKPVEQKLFKVFNEKPHNVVLLTEIGAD
ncbi:MAG: Nitrogenase-stabilizing/protective protein NifW 2 [Chroococcidiopsis sp. SAG 2025]|uniref:nitrogenase-stabilizing/protective protein NifW n=1 Tax=Chroococcidiopsis sp. SAG 2025 TaxID=171389 RepID=UPI0029370497|nr:nitrogenase-stabilizing/protective protein NifW [Chroococcidiopsis sp. SAG 2025]MDV2995462.1 Nitrogenase-stabilizing/protective protein NifW 2 [Chroococcidiopsis sp. SAG 2025]